MALKSSNKVDTNRIELEVEVSAEDFEKAVERVYRKNIGKLRVPGFRPGKAPRRIIEKMYGEEFFYEDAVNDVYHGALEAAVEEAELDLVKDEIDLDVISVGKEGLVFKAAVTVKPEVKISGYKGIEVTKPAVIVTEEQIEDKIKEDQKKNGRVVPVTERPAQLGDTALFDFEGFVDGVAFKGGKAENYTLKLGDGQFISGFEDQMVGHCAGEEFDVNVTFPDNYSEELGGKDAVFKVKIKELSETELPELDDEFAKDVSEFDTFDDYKESVREKLLKEAEKKSDDEVQNQIAEKLIDLIDAEIPEAMYNQRINAQLEETAYSLASSGIKLEQYFQYTGMDADKLRDHFRPNAIKQVKLRLALEKIAALENFTASDEELEAEYQKVADAYKIEINKIKESIDEKGLALDIAVEKAMNLVKESVVLAGTE